MRSLRRPTAEKAHRVEARGHARAEQIQWHRTPLGICHGCSRVVYTGETLALAGGSLLHGDCRTGALTASATLRQAS